MDIQKLYEMLPEFSEIKDEELRAKCANAFLQAMEEGGWDESNISALPVEPGKFDKCPLTFVEYTRMMTQVCLGMLEAYGEWKKTMSPEFVPDYVVAASLLQGIGKFREFCCVDGKAERSEYGKLYRYPWVSAWYAKENDLPLELVYTIVSTSRDYAPGKGKVIKTAANELVIDADRMCTELIMKLYY